MKLGVKTLKPRTRRKVQVRKALHACKEVNRILTETQQVHPAYQTHYFDVINGEYGLKGLIRKILTDYGAVLPSGIERTSHRKGAIAESMFTEEIITEVQKRFSGGTTRYPPQSISSFLGRDMLKDKQVGKIQLTGEEDRNRRPKRPRCKWYLPEDCT